jgi:uncharacterized protein involved in response to NO
VLGLLGLIAWIAFVLGAAPIWAFVAIKVGSFGLLLPVYFTVAHRMFPFFAGTAVAGYGAWRTFSLLAAFWSLALLHLALEIAHAYAWLWVADVPLCVMLLTTLRRWWPRGPAPGIKTGLFV